ncbi:hypothetical protein I4641_03325 [Waterburya agarophytonicola K14]|uniref:Uncharacterized protein n=1 Tax=Waterburya agarophytonicola KI4 TaxID=2874699 RepID=A0A964BME7_9CYAN|nr:hypothetical protein [Waterburya agarophytonicola]MCC0176010.1 hypothetical protein [Waterburya agarophytonicola KI4]
MKNQSNNDRVIQFLCQPQGGRNYLLNALNSSSESEFIDALHNVIDAMNQDYDLKISLKSDR